MYSDALTFTAFITVCGLAIIGAIWIASSIRAMLLKRRMDRLTRMDRHHVAVYDRAYELPFELDRALANGKPVSRSVVDLQEIELLESLFMRS